MPIPVICPGCHSRFQVSDQFAGKSGPCPKCKKIIQVPTKQQEVKIQEPEAFVSGGKSLSSRLVSKPIARKEFKLSRRLAMVAGLAVIGVVVVAWVGGGLLQRHLAIRALALLAVSLPLVLVAYGFLRDDELEPYRGRQLYVRAMICAAVYALFWGLFAYVSSMALTGDMWSWLIVAVPFLVAGAMVPYASLDLDYGSGFFHYSFYLLATMVLRKVAGMGWIWQPA